MAKQPPTALVILDGFGYSTHREGNPIASAKMPHYNKWCKEYPYFHLAAAGSAVGLPEGFMGNSEVGHLTMGAGRIVPSLLGDINKSIEDGSFFKNKILLENMAKLKKSGKALHLLGLLSDAGVHSHEEHIYALLTLAKKKGVKSVLIHAFLDGRDTPPKSAESYLSRLEKACKDIGIGTIASMHGRFYAMDRDQNWDRTLMSYHLLCPESKQEPSDKTWQELLQESYERGETDEFFKPTLLTKDALIKRGDGLMFFNFRPDRAAQFTEAFIDPAFKYFSQAQECKPVALAFCISMTRYKKEFEHYQNEVLFPHETVMHTLLDELAKHKKKVFIVAETEKYAHVTHFFRGERDKKTVNETREIVPSIKAEQYITQPEMSGPAITETLLKDLKKPRDFYLINYANADMVGHSSNFEATVKAVEYLDSALGELYEEIVKKRGGVIFLTGDHGNAEELLDPKTKEPTSTHTANPVPFLVLGGKKPAKETSKEYGLSHVAPTILQWLELPIPEEMIQETIIKK